MTLVAAGMPSLNPSTERVEVDLESADSPGFPESAECDFENDRSGSARDCACGVTFSLDGP